MVSVVPSAADTMGGGGDAVLVMGLMWNLDLCATLEFRLLDRK